MRFLNRHRQLMNTATGEQPTGAGAGPTGAGAGPTGTPPTPPTPPAPPAGEKPSGEEMTLSLTKSAFDERLSKASSAAERKLLRELGFEKPEDAKAALGTLKSLQDAQKTEQEKLQGRIKELEPKAQRADVLSKRFEVMAKAEFEKLPDNVREAIDKVANGDVDKQWEQMEFLRSTGLLSAGAAPPPPAAPKTNAPAGAPPPAPGTQLTKFQEFEAIREKNPMQASIFFRTNRDAIEASRPADK